MYINVYYQFYASSHNAFGYHNLYAEQNWSIKQEYISIYDYVSSSQMLVSKNPKNLRIHGPIKQRPKFDAGGLLVKDRSFAGADYVSGQAV